MLFVQTLKRLPDSFVSKVNREMTNLQKLVRKLDNFTPHPKVDRLALRRQWRKAERNHISLAQVNSQRKVG
jgi:hypothetical protein